jgi:hypothetical protein
MPQPNQEPELRLATGSNSLLPMPGSFSGRRRLISFRLSDEEYDGLKRLCDEHGASSLSEFVRANVCVMLQASRPWEEEVEEVVREFGRQANQLNGLVAQLSHLLRTALVRAR